MTIRPQTEGSQYGAVQPVDECSEDVLPQWPIEDLWPVPVELATLPQLVRVECVVEPPHAPMWMKYDDEAWYPPSCPDCAYVAMRDAHAGCEHSHHGAWRRWKLVNWLSGWAYQLGVLAGYGSNHDGYCNGCLTGFRWRSASGRSYVLGWPSWKWSCLLKKRHWPGGYVGFDCCTRCLPCPECGSTEWDHDVLHVAEGSGGRHRLSPQHPGWETAHDELEALLRAQQGE